MILNNTSGVYFEAAHTTLPTGQLAGEMIEISVNKEMSTSYPALVLWNLSFKHYNLSDMVSPFGTITVSC